jgi:hypothetical protein
MLDAALGVNGTSPMAQVEKMIDFLSVLQDSKYMSALTNASDIAKSISVSYSSELISSILFDHNNDDPVLLISKPIISYFTCSSTPHIWRIP